MKTIISFLAFTTILFSNYALSAIATDVKHDKKLFSSFFENCISSNYLKKLINNDKDMIIKLMPDQMPFDDDFIPKNAKQRAFKGLLLARNIIPTETEKKKLLSFWDACYRFDISKIRDRELKKILYEYFVLAEELNYQVSENLLTYKEILLKRQEIEALLESKADIYFQYIDQDVLHKSLGDIYKFETQLKSILSNNYDIRSG